MIKKKSLIFILVAILGFPQITLAESLINTNTLINNNSLEINEDNLLVTQHRGKTKTNKRRKRARTARRRVHRAYRNDRIHERRRDRLRNFRDGIREYRKRETIRDVVGGMDIIGIGAAISKSNRNDQRRTQTVIIDRGGFLQEQEYYGDLYQCQYLDRGGYYDAYELEECLRKQF